MGERVSVVVDTSSLMQQLDVLKDCVDDYEWIITTISLEELDNLKTSENLDKAFKARKALEWIDNNEDKIKFIINDNVTSDVFLDARFDLNKNDNKIINCCVSENAKLMSEDRALKIKAKAVGIDVLKLESIIGDNEFKGYKEVYFDDLDMAMWYEGEVRPNKWGLLNNEYLIIRDAKKKEVADILRWTNQGFKPLKYKTIKNKFIGNVIPRNTQQKILFDIMQDDNIKIKCAKGGYGVGKDFCMLSHAIDLIEKNKYENLIWIRNITNLRNVSDIGFLPGSADEKLLPWAMIMADHLGGEDGLKYFLSNGKIQLQHLGYIRGRSFRNSILYCSEAENLTKELMQLLISRVGDGSVLYINGDYKQVDHKVFEANSGLNAIVDKFKGYDEFGFVELEKIERSKVAQMAALLD